MQRFVQRCNTHHAFYSETGSEEKGNTWDRRKLGQRIGSYGIFFNLKEISVKILHLISYKAKLNKLCSEVSLAFVNAY